MDVTAALEPKPPRGRENRAVRPTDGGRVDPDEHVARAGVGLRYFPHVKNVGRSVACAKRGSHRRPILRSSNVRMPYDVEASREATSTQQIDSLTSTESRTFFYRSTRLSL